MVKTYYVNNEDCFTISYFNSPPYSVNSIFELDSRSVFTLYPNPVQEILNYNSELLVKNIRIYTIDGKLAASYNLSENRKGEISVSNLPVGVYVVKLFFASGETSFSKVVKNK